MLWNDVEKCIEKVILLEYKGACFGVLCMIYFWYRSPRFALLPQGTPVLHKGKKKKKKEKKASLVAMMLQRSFWPPTAHRNCGHTDLLSFGYPILPSMLTNHFACSVYSRYFETQELTAVSLILD